MKKEVKHIPTPPKRDHTLFIVWLHELKNIFRDEGMAIFFLLVPLGYPLLYAFIYTNEVVRHVPVIAIDLSNSRLSREFLRKVDATPDVHIAAWANSIEEGKQWMRQQKGYGIIYIPTDFSKKLHQNEQVHVSLFCDMSSLLYYKALLTACTEVSLAMNKAIQIKELTETTSLHEAETNIPPIHYDGIALSNPQMGFASFLIPAVLILIIQQTLLLGVGLSRGTKNEQRKRPTATPLCTIAGLALAYLPVCIVTSSYMLLGVPRFFHLIQLASPLTLAVFVFPYLLACIFMAITVSAFIPKREICMLVFVFSSIPLLFLSGISWPSSSIPAFWKVFSWLFPSTFGINGFVSINSMGANLSDVSTEYFALWLQAICYFLTAWFIQQREFNAHKKDRPSESALT